MEELLAKALAENNRRIMERYNRRCRRLVALMLAGRKVSGDHIMMLKTDMMRIGYESAVQKIKF